MTATTPTTRDLDRTKLQPLVTFYEGPLPDGYLGLTSHTAGEVFVSSHQSKLQYIETMLHELLHFLLEHDTPPSPRAETRIEELATKTARKVIFLEASLRPAHTKAAGR